MASFVPAATPYALGGVVGAALGALAVGAMLPGPAVEPRASTAPAAVTLCDVVPEPLEPLREQALQTELLARVLRGQVALLGGIPEPWPDGFDVATEQERVVAAVERALDEQGYGATFPVEVRPDCAEDPCLVQVVGGPADTPSAVRMTSAQYAAVQRALGDGGFVATEGPFTEGGPYLYVITAHPPARGTVRNERIRVRTERLHDEATR